MVSQDLGYRRNPAPLDRAGLELALRPFGESRMLPRAAYVDPAVFGWEQRHFFGGGWMCVARSEAPHRRWTRRWPNSTRSSCESVQRGLSSPYASPGPLAPDEDAVYSFVTTIARGYLGEAGWNGVGPGSLAG